MAGKIPEEGIGVFFPQQNKKNDRAPDWKGQIMHNGEIIKFSGWIKRSSYGEFLSLAVDRPYTPQEKEQSDAYKAQWPKEVNTLDDGEVPF